MDVIFTIGIILILIKLIGEGFERISLPSIFGEIILGIILGPLLKLIIISTSDGSLTHSAATIKLLGEIGIIFLLFSIGFEKIELERFSVSIIRSLPTAILGTIFPFLGGFLAAIIFHQQFFGQSSSINGPLLVGLAMSATSIGVSLRALSDMRYLATAAGSAIIISAVAGGFIGLVILSVIMGIIQTGNVSFHTISIIFLETGGFGLLIFLAGKYVFPWLSRLIDRMIVEEATFAIIIGILFMLAYLTEKMGLSAIIGAFLFGISISIIPRFKTETMSYRISGISNGFFVPFFFFNIGLLLDFKSIGNIGLFGSVLVLLTILSQVMGGFIGGKIGRFNLRDSLIIGIALIPRNELTLVIATVGLNLGMLTKDVFSAIILVVIVSVLITPLMLRAVVGKSGR
ncbi:cation:proton antiporter [Candidatus Desantisbacteria bacterium]|nr:cation:proton antiporter [Candidatus Desantisbacteria bacterium]